MAFTVTLLVLGLVASVYWLSIQRHTLMHKRTEHARTLYLAETGVTDAMAKLRIGTISRAIASDYSYCLNPTTGAISGPPCLAPTSAFPIRVVISPKDANGLNPINVTVNF